jgi:hypothetical protein
LGADETAEVDVFELELCVITPPAVGALEDAGAGATEDEVRAADVVGAGAGESEAADDCAEDLVVFWLEGVLVVGDWAVCELGGGSAVVVEPPWPPPPPPPQAAVNNGAMNTITAVVALSRRCQFRFVLSWTRSM